MSRTRLAVRGLLAACIVAFAVSPALAAAPIKFQVEATGLGALLSGGSTLADGRDRRDVYPPGYGFAFAATLGVTSHIVLGVRTGLIRERKDGIDPAIALERWQDLPGYSRFRAAQATSIDRTLSTIPTHGFVQWRGKLTKKLGYYAEAGAGVASFTDKIEYSGPNGVLMRLSAYQKDLSLLGGGGLSWDWGTLASIIGGVDVEQIPGRKGEIWVASDDPRLVHIELGFRYPRR